MPVPTLAGQTIIAARYRLRTRHRRCPIFHGQRLCLPGKMNTCITFWGDETYSCNEAETNYVTQGKEITIQRSLFSCSDHDADACLTSSCARWYTTCRRRKLRQNTGSKRRYASNFTAGGGASSSGLPPTISGHRVGGGGCESTSQGSNFRCAL